MARCTASYEFCTASYCSASDDLHAANCKVGHEHMLTHMLCCSCSRRQQCLPFSGKQSGAGSGLYSDHCIASACVLYHVSPCVTPMAPGVTACQPMEPAASTGTPDLITVLFTPSRWCYPLRPMAWRAGCYPLYASFKCPRSGRVPPALSHCELFLPWLCIRACNAAADCNLLCRLSDAVVCAGRAWAVIPGVFCCFYICLVCVSSKHTTSISICRGLRERLVVSHMQLFRCSKCCCAPHFQTERSCWAIVCNQLCFHASGHMM